MKPLFRIWQFLVIAAAASAYAAGVLLNCLFLLPLIYLCGTRKEVRRRMVRRLISAQFRLFLSFLRFCRILIVEPAAAPELGRATLIVANHPSLLDILILIAHFPEADCLVKKSLWRNPLVAPMLISAGYLSNDDAAGFLESAAERLGAGFPIVIFPEGTRSPPQGMFPFHRSAASLALRHACQILPVRLEFSHRVLAKGQPIFRFPPCSVRCRLEFRELVECGDPSPGRSQSLTRQLEVLLSPGSPDGTGNQRTDRQDPQP
ncbi:MAG: hypothetical protein RL095_71 [Verrucomicrobiota bacterium]|jgi:1-acyl-sn-glycerol-3-phosphate acyltransferase